MFKDGKRWYQGEFEEGVPQGRGIFHHGNGTRTAGEFVDGMICGSGTRFFSNGWKLIAVFDENHFQGTGRLEYNETEFYEGEFESVESLLPHGKGYKLFRLGNTIARYRGMLEFGLLSGKGKLVLDSGDVYEGHFRGNYRHGFGKYTYANGDTYIGQFVDDEFSGEGEFNYQNGNLYVGQFEKNKMNGIGRFVWHCQETIDKLRSKKRKRSCAPRGSALEDQETSVLVEYVGKFANGKLEPFGKLRFKDGSLFEGRDRKSVV